MNAFDHPALSEIDYLGPMLTEVGRRLERDPTDWKRLWDNDFLRAIALIEVPDPFNPQPNCDGIFGSEPVGYDILIASIERMARHDVSCIMAMPTPTMAGFAVRELGNQTQKEFYFRRYLGGPCRSFFAVTEPHVGSDATHGQSRVGLKRDGLSLKVHKKLVGGAAQSDAGLIFVRDDRTKSHKLVLVDRSLIDQFEIVRLKTNGLAGADLVEIIADDVPIEDSNLLGHGLDRGLRDGFFAMNRVFERYRPFVAAMAIGVARGLLDQLSSIGLNHPALDSAMIRHAAFTRRLSDAATAYSLGSQKMHEISRLKVDAVDFLDGVVNFVFAALPGREIFSNPAIIKKCRDAKAFEYMEGTSNIHRLQSFRSYAAEVQS